jgi:major capsid protein E
MLDIFSSNPAFSVTSLTMALMKMPFQAGRIGELGLYSERRLSTISTTIEVKSGRLAFVPSTARGSPPAQNVEDRRELIPFLIPHFPLGDTLMADEIQGVRAFGTEDTLEAMTQKVDEKLTSMGRKHDVTLEYLRLGGVKGVVVTRTDRVTGLPQVIIDLRQAFGMPPKPLPPVAPQTYFYDLDWPIVMPPGLTGDQIITAQNMGSLTDLIMVLVRLMADRLGAMGFSRVHGVCGRNFFDAFVKHPELRATYINQPAANTLRDPLWMRQVTFREVTIEEYRGQVGPTRFVDDDYCHFFPVGVPDLFVEAYAPADYIETVNTIALPRYAKQEVIPFGKGIMFETQQNVLPLCSLPDTLLTVRATPYVP